MKDVFSAYVLLKNYLKNFIWCFDLLQDFFRFGEIFVLCEGKCHKSNLTHLYFRVQLLYINTDQRTPSLEVRK